MFMQRVSQGQAFRPSAAVANRTAAAVEAIERMSRQLRGGSLRVASERDVVLAANDTLEDVPMFGVVAPTATMFTPSEDLDGFKDRPGLRFERPSATTLGLFGIALEPIPSGAVGRIVLSGLAVAQIEVTDPEATEAAEVVDEWDRLVTAAHGTARIVAREPGTGLKWGLVLLGVGLAAGVRWKVDSSELVAGSDPSRWKYTLRRATCAADGGVTVGADAETVYAFNDFEDQDDWGHGQSLSPGSSTALTPSPVTGPVPAEFSGTYDEDGTPIYRFDVPCPMTSACTGIDDAPPPISQATAEDIAEGP